MGKIISVEWRKPAGRVNPTILNNSADSSGIGFYLHINSLRYIWNRACNWLFKGMQMVCYGCTQHNMLCTTITNHLRHLKKPVSAPQEVLQLHMHEHGVAPP